jgi:hypothetical protein
MTSGSFIIVVVVLALGCGFAAYKMINPPTLTKFEQGYHMGAYNYIDKMSWCAFDAKRSKDECVKLLQADVEDIMALHLVRK